MNQTINTFTAGINQDLAKSLYKEGNYLDASNITLLTDSGLSTAVVQNKKGNKLQVKFPLTIPASNYEASGEYPVSIPAQDNLIVIGGSVIIDSSGIETLIFFTKSRTTSNSSYEGYGQIWKCNFLGTTDDISGTINGYQLSVNFHMIYNRFLNFKFVTKLKVISKFENSNIARVYWRDSFNPLRSFNTIGPNNALLETPVRTLPIVSGVNLDAPVISRLIKGSLPEGKYQLAYRLLSKYGDLTNFSTCSNLIDVIEGDEFNSVFGYPAGDTLTFTNDGQAKQDTKEFIDSGKGIEYYLAKVDKDYDLIQYALIHYSQPNIPEIYVYPYKEVSLHVKQYESFTDLFTDTYILNLDEFNVMYSPFETAEAIAVKDNILYAANTKNEMFKVNADFRAYRYDSGGYAITYELDGTANTFTTNYPNDNLLDVINSYNDESGKIFGLNPGGNPSTWYNSHQFKYKQDGVTLGGQGPNISYTFAATPILVDVGIGLAVNSAPLIKTKVDNNNVLQSVPYHITNNNGSFSSLKSPYKASCQVSWQRGEVYRFGIVFINTKGQTSYVNWIGDIKMPDFNESNRDFSLLSANSDGNLYMYSTYINFDVTVPEGLGEDISGFRIVYVERRDNDKTRFGTAITGGLNNFDRPGLAGEAREIVSSIVATVICYKIARYIDDIDGAADLFKIKEGLRNKIITTVAAALAQKLQILPDAAFQRVVSSEDIADFVDNVLDGAVNTDGGLGVFGSLVKTILPKTIERIKESVKEDLRSVLAAKVAGIHPNVLSLGQIGFAYSGFPSSTGGFGILGYTISPEIDFDKYTFKQGDYLKPINKFGQDQKIIHELHRDNTVGLYNILDSSAYLKKWYKGAIIPWNQVADSDSRRIYIKNQKVLIPGELLGTGFEDVFTNGIGGSGELDYVLSNSYIATIPQADNLGRIFNSASLIATDIAIAVKHGFENANNSVFQFSTAVNFLNKVLRPHSVLGIGDKKQFIAATCSFSEDGSSGIPRDSWGDPLDTSWLDYESHLEGLKDELLNDARESIRLVDYIGDYTVSYNRPISINQYGGIGFSSRANNEYIPASEFRAVTDKSTAARTYSIKANLGDTYLGVYDAVNYCYYYNAVKPNGYQPPIRSKKGLYEIFPCESSFNFNLREGEHPITSLSLDDLKENSEFKTDSLSNPDQSKLFKFVKKTTKAIKRTEGVGVAGAIGVGAVIVGGAALAPIAIGAYILYKRRNAAKKIAKVADTGQTVLTTERFLLSEFKYNDVFHQKYNINRFFPPSLFFDNEVDEYSNRIWNSKLKIDGEIIDSWRDFQFVDYLDVEGTQGPITELIVNKNKLLFYQQNGIGVASSNERGAVQGESGNIVLSNNKILLRYDYITKETGTAFQEGIVNTNSNVYHYDSNINKIFKLGEGLECISDNLGLFSKFQTITNNINKNPKGAIGIYDVNYQTVYFTFKDFQNSNNDFTLGFNEKLGVFESFYSFKPDIYLNLNQRVFSSLGNDECYWHNKGDYGSFYGTYYPSSVKFLTNENPTYTKVWDNQQFQTEVYDTNGVLLNLDTIDTIQHTTENQDAGLITLVPQTNINKVERDWKLQIQRDLANATYSTLSKPRLRDLYLQTELTFTNEDNKRFILHPITTFYRQSIH
jgi:hypothetical protein